MKKLLLIVCVGLFAYKGFAQTDAEATNPQLKKANEEKAKQLKGEAQKNVLAGFSDVKILPTTGIKNQGMTGTCWCFSTTSLVESQCLKNNLGDFDLSEMYAVRNTYIEKAKNYILRQGHAQFSEGGLGHDLINAIEKYGAMPENVYSGILITAENMPSKLGRAAVAANDSFKATQNIQHNHVKLISFLKKYVDSIVKATPVSENWLAGFESILNKELGTPPSKFMYNGKEYTPKAFASDVLKFNANDYIYLTSFTHHPYYQSFVIEVPDNFSNGSYYNLPLNEMLDITKDVLIKGYSVLWDADVSNEGFMQKNGIAVNLHNADTKNAKKVSIVNGSVEGKWNAAERQKLFENLTTQDDHLMHIVGMGKNKDGKLFFNVKNSWGDVGPSNGFINVSEAYFAMNTITIIVPKVAFTKEMLKKYKMN
ncbi:MAG: aminopeptidase [Ferruginibacter sp.]|nr:aminopeptidase [Ferruginibacter sp.]